MSFIKVWCEYDFNGRFGENNNEEVLEVEEDKNGNEIEKAVLTYLTERTGLYEMDLESLYGWKFINIKKLK